MLKAAIIYRDEIIKNIREYFYTDDMLYLSASLDNWVPDIDDNPSKTNFQFAIVEDDKLIGYLSYRVDWYSSKVYNFGIISFDRGNPLVGKALLTKIEELLKSFHKIEWRAVSGNPACKAYKRFTEKHDGLIHILRDSLKDRNGEYRDSIIYEIFGDEK